jgi:hypothetical protein
VSNDDKYANPEFIKRGLKSFAYSTQGAVNGQIQKTTEENEAGSSFEEFLPIILRWFNNTFLFS